MRQWTLALLIATAACAQPPFTWPDNKRVAVTLSFDDARPTQVTNGIDLLARHKARATFYVNPRNMIK